MGINSTSTAWGFQQFGSVLLSGDDAYLDLSGANAKYYICAITFLEETFLGDTNASGLQVLDGGVNLGLGNTHFASTEDTQTLDTDWGASTNAGDNDGQVVVEGSSGTAFPGGMTLYGMYDYIELHSGSCIVYVAPRPDYHKRSAAI
tara:strand:+ start:28 stop:468 length:441 start_codon:yes stop_codon:yes gene_type:complete